MHIFSLCKILYKISGNPGEFLAPWIRKKFQFKQLIIFKYIIFAIRNGVYILAILFLGNMHILCGVAIYIAMFICNLLESAVSIAQKDTKIRITDYQMYISGERLEEYKKIITWFTTPITTIISLIIPLMFYRVGFTSDWDVLYMSDVRVQCMLIGIGFMY